MTTYYISDQLLYWRNKLGKTQEEMAKLLRIYRNTYISLETGNAQASDFEINLFNEKTTLLFIEHRNPMQRTLLEKQTVHTKGIDFDELKRVSKFFSAESGGSFNLNVIYKFLGLTTGELAKLLGKDNYKGIAGLLHDKFFALEGNNKKVATELMTLALLTEKVFKGKEDEMRLWLRLPSKEFNYKAPLDVDIVKVILYLESLR